MSRAILFSIALVLAASSAHAEKLTRAQIDSFRAGYAQACSNTATLITPTWLRPGEAGQVCSCTDDKATARMKDADFADAANLTKADHKRIDDIGTNAAGECLQPYFAKGVERMAVRRCVEEAPGIAALQSLPADKVPSICACAGEAYIQTADLRDIDQIADPDGMLMKHIGDLLKPMIASCKAR